MRPLCMPRLLLAAAACLPLAAMADPVAYGVGFRDLYRVDLATGTHTRVGPVGFNDIEGLAFVGLNELYGAVDFTRDSGGTATDFLIRINVSTGQGTLVGPLSGLAGAGPDGQLDYGLAATCDGRLWLSSETTQELWEVSRLNGGVRRVGSTGASLSGLAGRESTLYGVSVGDGASLFRINPETGETVRVGALGVGGPIENVGLDFDANGVLWATLDPRDSARPTRVVRINLDTGAATLVSNINLDVGIKGLAIATPPACTTGGGGGGASFTNAPTEVPGPGPLLLGLLAALTGLLGVRGLARRD
ncbi:DUF4394 domain-containing protein [Pseudomarimonas salicorniae]|uniref:DUF4394 domain-containing protein n=1 Tax=Pseudomarimonas salicorniae TaxID=2933270 RepID=A0ABT0GJ16_9GAMM|nr:DUF4394 domain-containing protein [Lysobacter sp. CAU 1642]MCK7594418.1 DUF4394 domain-containing protein [Lysobacter sp. CAU 1642]